MKTTALYAFPMHGQHKLSQEGYRTRDGHLIQWFGRLLSEVGGVSVVSRPEPLAMWPMRRVPYSSLADNTYHVSSWSPKLPNISDRRTWWVQSLPNYPLLKQSVSGNAVVWNPFAFRSRSSLHLAKTTTKVLFDLLDDWTVHYAFNTIRNDVREAYRIAFDMADYVTANSEATAELARGYGRSDVQLVTNGCDPEIFSTRSTARGPLTVGYVGKIGKRVDLDLVKRAASALPDVNFVMAGPILDREYERPLKAIANVTLVGDVHYRDVPEILQTFDVGWVPHRVGAGEVGGDVIKTYEYRAAGLPVLTTPVLGATDRGLDCVTALDAGDHISYLKTLSRSGPRVDRVPTAIPINHTWRQKAESMLCLLDLDVKR